MLWPPAQVKVYNLALTPEYSFVVALDLKGLDSPDIASISYIIVTIII